MTSWVGILVYNAQYITKPNVIIIHKNIPAHFVVAEKLNTVT